MNNMIANQPLSPELARKIAALTWAEKRYRSALQQGLISNKPAPSKRSKHRA